MRYLAIASVIAAGLVLTKPALAHSSEIGEKHFRFADVKLPAADGAFVNPVVEPVSPVKEFLGELLMLLASALLIAAKIGLGFLVKYLREKGETNKTLSALAIGTELIQTYVAKAEVELKPEFAKAAADGKITAEEGAALKAKVIEVLKRDMPADLWKALQRGLGPAVDGWVSGKVEESVADAHTP